MRSRTSRSRMGTLAAMIAVAMTTALAGCSSGPDAVAEGDAAPMTIKLGHVNATGSPWHRAAENLAEKLAERTDGRLTVEIYPSSQLGSTQEMQEGLEFGSVDVIIESMGSLEKYSPLAAIDGLPFIYEDQDSFLEVWDSPLGDEIKESLVEETGFRLIGNLYRGSRMLNSARPVAGIDELHGLKIRVPIQQSYIDTWDALGASPMPLAMNEVFSALEQRAIDAQENPLDVIRFDSLYEVAPFVTETNHLFGNFHFIVWDDAFASWPEEYREAFVGAVDEVTVEHLEAQLTEIEANRDFLKSEGVEFFDISGEIDEWRERVSGIVDANDPKVQEWVERIRSHDLDATSALT